MVEIEFLRFKKIIETGMEKGKVKYDTLLLLSIRYTYSK